MYLPVFSFFIGNGKSRADVRNGKEELDEGHAAWTPGRTNGHTGRAQASRVPLTTPDFLLERS